ncbi:putative glutamyl-trna amidotransferase subunit a [Phaeomoniella chlamydospora]|uniref:Putative glutamyl-trna amidotransferase subunit a n=1 Tax=Phaeomoniella chlamydospora TaxID=158046 RepID=A0A0G2G290_PHACM|nr:putative glutamyl-trna amidotransferase subunit a [Phaeomoniella chlamydospora]
MEKHTQPEMRPRPDEPCLNPKIASRHPIFYFIAVILAVNALLQSSLLDPGKRAPQHNPHTQIGNSFPSLIEATIEDLITGLESGVFTSVDLVNAYVVRITEVNSRLHAVTELNPDALAIAAMLDGERRNGNIRGLLHGIPILLKDNIATMDHMNNTAGSYALVGAKVPEDSTIASKLRKSGAIILGKANLSQWAYWRSNNTSSGWSAYGGQVSGAYYPDQDPSGSSSGSGVASSLGLALATLGSETAGSIIAPSERNNLVGIKPTVGLTSRYLVVPISERQDTIGPMARTVKDAAYMLQEIAGVDPKDNYTSAIPFTELPDYVEACKFSALRGKRLGVPRNAIQIFNTASPVIKAFDAALDILRAAGATVIENTNFTVIPSLRSGELDHTILCADFTSNLPAYLSKLSYNPNSITDLQSVRNFTISHPLEAYPDRNVAIWDTSLSLGFNNSSPEFWPIYQEALRMAGPDGLFGALQNHSLDALVLPTNFASVVPAIVGAPVISVPLGAYPADTPVTKNKRGDLVDTAPNVPFGLSFIGDRFSEELLIGLAYAFEQRTKVRGTIQPYVMPKTELEDVVLERKKKEMMSM